MHDACLDGRFGEDRLDRLREAFEPVDAADQDVPHAALLFVEARRLARLDVPVRAVSPKCQG
jgi:hypothetical protein